jgi:hypothetical protein
MTQAQLDAVPYEELRAEHDKLEKTVRLLAKKLSSSESTLKQAERRVVRATEDHKLFLARLERVKEAYDRRTAQIVQETLREAGLSQT